MFQNNYYNLSLFFKYIHIINTFSTIFQINWKFSSNKTGNTIRKREKETFLFIYLFIYYYYYNSYRKY